MDDGAYDQVIWLVLGRALLVERLDLVMPDSGKGTVALAQSPRLALALAISR